MNVVSRRTLVDGVCSSKLFEDVFRIEELGIDGFWSMKLPAYNENLRRNIS